MKMNTITNLARKAMQLGLAALLAGSAAASAQNVTNSVGVKTDYCADFLTQVTRTCDSQGPYYDVWFKQKWTVQGSTNTYDLPHGVYVEFTNATINTGVNDAIPFPSGQPWFTTGPAPTRSFVTNYGVYWNKPPVGSPATPPNVANAVPSNMWQKMRIRVTESPAPVGVTVNVRELTGWSWPNDTAKWNCQSGWRFSSPLLTYDIGPSKDVCTGDIFSLPLTGTLPAGATIAWYQSHTCPPAGADPEDPASGWGPALDIGGTQFPTNYLTQTTCYIAVVHADCWKYLSNIGTLTVCQSKPIATIAVFPAVGYPVLQQLAPNEWHACRTWKGRITLTPSSSPCTPTITWSESIDGAAYTPLGGTGTAINTGLLTVSPSVPPAPPHCSTTYQFRASLTNACGTTDKIFTIVIDAPPSGGYIKTLTGQLWDIGFDGFGTRDAPRICYDTGTSLKNFPGCGTIDHWEASEETSPCSGVYGPFVTVPGSFNTSIWYTGFLTKTTRYQAWVVNGACGGTFSKPITVTVKPELTVSIATPSSLLCSNPTLTATTSYDAPCSYTTATYQWYLNGVAIPDSTLATCIPSAAGNYSVMIDDKSCGHAESNVITICQPALAVLGPCCMCQKPGSPSETVALSAAIINNTCDAPISYLWSTNDTTSTINVNIPGTYKVEVTVGTCVLDGEITISTCDR